MLTVLHDSDGARERNELSLRWTAIPVTGYCPTDTEVGSSVSGHRPPCGDCCLPLVSAVGRTASVPPRERSAEHVGVATALGRLWLSRSRIELRRERGGEGTSADKTTSREENEQECS